MTFQNNFVAVIKTDGKILKEDRRSFAPVVYLPFGSEYSIKLKNLHSRKAQVKVSIDGEDVLNGRSLIIDGNNELELERFIKDSLDKGNRFKFIEKTQQISDYRGDKIDDGVVRITYQFERYVEPLWYGGVTHIANPTYTKNIFYSSHSGDLASTRIGSSINCCASNNIGGVLNSAVCDSNKDGITVPGSVSEQQFKQGYIGALENEVHVITLILRGGTGEVLVEKPVIVAKKKIRCKVCGTKSLDTAKFCSNCSAALKQI
jgi:hypothetical protein